MIIIADRQLSLKRYFIILQCRSDDQLLADIFFKLSALYQFLCPDEQDEGAVGGLQHTVNFVDADVAVFCRFSGGQRHFEVDGTVRMFSM